MDISALEVTTLSEVPDEKIDRKRVRIIAAFWILGLLNNSLFCVMNAGASEINDTAIGYVYLAGTVPALMVSLTGPYWFPYVSYTARVWISSLLMIGCLFVVAWGEGSKVKLLGVVMAAFQCGLGESSLLAMTSFYCPKYSVMACSSGTGFAGVMGYIWAILFEKLGACFKVQLMTGLWIPFAWVIAYHVILPPLKSRRNTGDHTAVLENQGNTPEIRFAERMSYSLTLWKYLIPLFVSFVTSYLMQAGVWSSMGFPDATDRDSRNRWYHWSNLINQLGVFVARTVFGFKTFSLPSLWAVSLSHFILLALFSLAAVNSWGHVCLLFPALLVGLLSGYTYVQACSLISLRESPDYVEVALATAPAANSIGTIAANIAAIFVQGCLFGMLGVTDTIPDYKCGYDIWGTTHVRQEAVCFAAMEG